MGEKKVGKVRDVYIAPDKIILISTDRHSSFDRNIAFIPFKGEVLNQISAFWFENTKDIIQNHVICVPDPAVLVAKKFKPLPIECIMRGYITGVTSTSPPSKNPALKRDLHATDFTGGSPKKKMLNIRKQTQFPAFLG